VRLMRKMVRIGSALAKTEQKAAGVPGKKLRHRIEINQIAGNQYTRIANITFSR